MIYKFKKMKYVLEYVFVSNLLHLTRMKLLLLHLNDGSKGLFKKVCLFNHCTIRKLFTCQGYLLYRKK